MINQFGSDTALLLIDVQQGVDVLEHWGGPTGRRNNPDAETHMDSLLTAWRKQGLPVAYTQHDSREAASPLKLSIDTGAMKTGFEPQDGDIVVVKDVNSAFVGTSMEVQLRRAGVSHVWSSWVSSLIFVSKPQYAWRAIWALILIWCRTHVPPLTGLVGMARIMNPNWCMR